MSRAQAESVIKNIIREIIQECKSNGENLSETLVAFIVKAVVLDPDNEFNVDRTLTKDDVQRLINFCVERLSNRKSPSLDTVKMQVYFDMNYTGRREFLDEHKKVLESRLNPVTREITDSRARTREELESLYRKIVSYLLLRSGLGSPTDIGVVREATAALQSVFPQTELGTFMQLSKRDKVRQLHELTLIVTGIRLFNKECGKGGEGIDNLSAILNEAIPATTQNVDAEIQISQESAAYYTALVEQFDTIKPSLPKEMTIELIKESLINVRQHESFLRILLNDIIGCAKQVDNLINQFAISMESLQQTVQSKAAVPTAQVYPQFVTIANLWTCFQDEMVLLSVLSNLLANLEQFTRTHKEVLPNELLAPYLDQLTIKTDSERMDETSKNRVDPTEYVNKPNMSWLFPETTKNFDNLIYQYRGYCGFTLAANDRLLLPGNPRIGVLQYRDQYYVFSSSDAAKKFVEDPEFYRQQIAEVAKKSPELIQLLELYQQFSTLSSYSGDQKRHPVMKQDQGMQTVTHITEKYIDRDYQWNEWELRRKAIRLANLRTKLTHSTQTALSHMRRDNSSQVYLPKDQSVQTKKDGSSNVPKPANFMAGIRGFRGEGNFQQIDLTPDINQS